MLSIVGSERRLNNEIEIFAVFLTAAVYTMFNKRRPQIAVLRSTYKYILNVLKHSNVCMYYVCTIVAYG